MNEHVLLITVDIRLGHHIENLAARKGYVLTWERNAEQGLLRTHGIPSDLVLLDADATHTGTPLAVQALRSRLPGAPILILTTDAPAQHRIRILDAGADDLISQPVDMEELAARMRARLRRHVQPAQAPIRIGDLLLAPVAFQCSYRGRPLTLSHTQFVVLRELAEACGGIVSRDALMQAMYSADESPESNTLAVCIHALRGKLSPKAIRTVRGVGYAFQADLSYDVAEPSTAGASPQI